MSKRISYFFTLLLVLGLTLSACDMGTQPGAVAPGDDPLATEPVATLDTETLDTETDVLTDTAITAPINEPLTTTDTMTTTDAMTATDALTTTGPLVLAYTLIDQPFVNADGEISGEINDLVVDLRSGNILFAQIEYGGFLDLGDTELLVPLRAMQWRSTEQDMILNFDEQMLENYPDIAEGSPRLGDSAWDTGVATFWNNLGFGDDADSTAAVDPTTNPIVPFIDFVGFSLVDFGAGVGTIQDLLIDVNRSRARYMLVGFGTTAAATMDGAYLIPFSAVDIVDLDTTAVTLRADLTAEMLVTAPRLDRALFQGDVGALDPSFFDQADAFWEEQGYSLEVGNN
jgi:sporulation protein YlmC with PRC-barrel domain